MRDRGLVVERRHRVTVIHALSTRGRHQHGFTVIELLVSLGVVSILVATTLPAIQQAREASRAMQCRNNLRQLTTAVLNFESIQGTLPYENAAGPTAGWNPGSLSGWVQILPELGHSSIYDTVDFDEDGAGVGAEPSTSSKNAALLDVRLPVLICPSDSGPSGMNSYRSCQGTAALRAPSRNRKGFGRPGAAYSFGSNRRKATMAMIKDGFGNTAIYSEKIVGDRDPMTFNPARDSIPAHVGLVGFGEPDVTEGTCRRLLGGPVYEHSSFGGASWLFTGYADTWYNHILVPNAVVPDCTNGGPSPYWEAAAAARSWHAGDVNVVSADGAARFVSERVDVATWRSAATRAESEAIGDW